MLKIQVFAPFLALCAAACSALQSTHVDYASLSPVSHGVHYALPKGVFRIELVQHNDDIHVAVSRPMFVGDPNAAFMLEQSSGLFADQQYLLVVEPETRLLTYVNSASQGRAGQILQNLARSAVAVANASDEGSRGPHARVIRTIYSRIVDPFTQESCEFGRACNLASTNAELRTTALEWFHCDAANGGDAPELCSRLRAHADFFQLTLAPLYELGAAGGDHSALINACRRSICYRAPAPYAFSLRVNGVVDLSEIVLLPNEAPVMAMDVPAGVFARASTRIDLYQGMPARYAIDRQNELVAVTLVPFNVVKEGFAAVGEVLRFRVDYNSARVNDLRSQRALDAARAEGRAQGIASAQSAGEPNAPIEPLGDAPSASGSFGDEGSRTNPIDDDTGMTTVTAPASLNVATPAVPLFDVSLTQEAEPSAANSADIGRAESQH